MDACIETASSYFNYIHDPSHNLFHRPTFMADLARGAVLKPIILCVLALAARFSKHSFFSGAPPRLRGGIYAREAEKQLDLHNASLTTIQTTVLLGAFYGTEGDSLHENLYYSLACRIGCLLNLPESLSDTPLNWELGIRLWWTLDMIDVWSSNSTQLPRLLVPRSDVSYPTSDDAFLRMRRTHSFSHFPGFPAQEAEAESVLVQKLKLSPLLSEIARLNKASADGTMTTYDTQITTDALAHRLIEWHQQLPDELINTPENLATQAALGSGGAFVALHVGFYHFSQLLYYRFLHHSLLFDVASSPSLNEIHVYAERCRDNSTALCELLYAAQILPGAEVFYSMVGHALVISSTVQLHILLFSDDEVAINTSRFRLERNYLILCSLQSLWRTIDHTFGRFREFHQACMKAKANVEDPSSPFRLDKWMLRFLMEYSQPVVGRDEEAEGPRSHDGQDRQRELDRGAEHELFRETLADLGIRLDDDRSWDSMLNLDHLRNCGTGDSS